MSTNSNEEYLLEVKDLHTSFFTESGEVKAVNGVSFTLNRWLASVENAVVSFSRIR